MTDGEINNLIQSRFSAFVEELEADLEDVFVERLLLVAQWRGTKDKLSLHTHGDGDYDTYATVFESAANLIRKNAPQDNGSYTH